MTYIHREEESHCLFDFCAKCDTQIVNDGCCSYIQCTLYALRCTLYAEKDCPENLFILKLHTLILYLFDKVNRKKTGNKWKLSFIWNVINFDLFDIHDISTFHLMKKNASLTP